MTLKTSNLKTKL